MHKDKLSQMFSNNASIVDSWVKERLITLSQMLMWAYVIFGCTHLAFICAMQLLFN